MVSPPRTTLLTPAYRRRLQRYLDVRSVEDAEFALRHIPLGLCAWSASAGLRVLQFGSQDLRPIVVGSVIRKGSSTVCWMLELELARNGDLARYHRVIQKASTFTTSRTFCLAVSHFANTQLSRAAKLPMFFEAWIHPHLYEDGVRTSFLPRRSFLIPSRLDSAFRKYSCC